VCAITCHHHEAFKRHTNYPRLLKPHILNQRRSAMNTIIITNKFFVGLLGILLLVGDTEQTASAQTVTIPTLEGTIGSPVNFAYTPGFFVVMDPTQTIGFGMQPYLTVGGTLLDVECNGAGAL